ncbi:Tellurite resistance protein TerB [Synechococcus sp. RSCCF101]|nr:tellurite resistance TerB family protein [Synechococcus sp. RSCCF101]QEY33408.1 Tellurite resistance protein TerB [Synechococcus sp. RSCCF101]
MDSLTAFAAIALTAVSWDGVLSQAGSRALRHELDYREPFASMKDGEMVALMDELLERMRRLGVHELMVEAAQALSPEQRRTAYAVAAEIMRSDGPLVEEERCMLGTLATTLSMEPGDAQRISSVMDVLHGSVVDCAMTV